MIGRRGLGCEMKEVVEGLRWEEGDGAWRVGGSVRMVIQWV